MKDVMEILLIIGTKTTKNIQNYNLFHDQFYSPKTIMTDSYRACYMWTD